MFNIRSLVLVLGIFAAGCNSCSSDSSPDASIDATVSQDVVVEDSSVVDTGMVTDTVDAAIMVDVAQDRSIDAAHD